MLIIVLTLIGPICLKVNGSFISFEIVKINHMFKNRNIIEYKNNKLIIKTYDSEILVNLLYFRLTYGIYRKQIQKLRKMIHYNKFLVLVEEKYYPSYQIKLILQKCHQEEILFDSNSVIGLVYKGKATLYRILKKIYNQSCLKLRVKIKSSTKLFINFYDIWSQIKANYENFLLVMRYNIRSKKVSEKSGNLGQWKINSSILEIIGDITKFDILPSEKILFICKLNSSTNEEV